VIGLRRLPRFAPLTDDDVELLERVLVVQSFPAGHVFVHEGDRASAVTAEMHVLLEGSIEVAAARPTGGYAVHRTLGPGEIFGHVALVADVVRTATCRSATPVVTARMDRRVFEELYRHGEGLAARFQLVLARQLASDVRALHELLLDCVATGDDAELHGRFG
jgi:CRP-like cAMP-binding protein